MIPQYLKSTKPLDYLEDKTLQTFINCKLAAYTSTNDISQEKAKV